MMVPDIPETVAIKVKREQYLAKQALAENKVIFTAHKFTVHATFFFLGKCFLVQRKGSATVEGVGLIQSSLHCPPAASVQLSLVCIKLCPTCALTA